MTKPTTNICMDAEIMPTRAPETVPATTSASITRPLTSPLWRREKYSMGKPYMRVTILAAMATVRRVCNCSTPLRCIQITGPSKNPNAPIPSKNHSRQSLMPIFIRI